MRKKLLLVLVVTLLAIATVAVFAACNDSMRSGDGASGNSPVIDVPFVPVTEGTEGLQFKLFDENSRAADFYGIDISGYWVTGYKGDETDVVIPNMYEGKRVIGVTDGAFTNALITSVNISNGIKYLDIAGIAEVGAVFYDCTNLKSVTLPQSLTNIDAFIFMNCPSITSVTIPANVSEITINPFLNCENLKEVKVSKDNGNYYIDSKYLYEKKTNKIISTFNVGSSVTIPDSVTGIGHYAFVGCTSLTSVTIPDSVTSIGSSAFSGCTSLTSVTIPDSVTSIGYNAFYNTPFYNNISNGEVYLGKVLYEYKGNMPANYTANVKDGTVSISPHAFYNCTSLTSVTIPDSVTSIGEYAFRGCDTLETITVDSGNSVYHSAGNCLIETATKTLIAGCKNSVIPDDGSVTRIGNYAFDGCTSLTSVTIPDSVTSIGRSAFDSCGSLTSVTIGDSVESIGYEAFNYCTSLTSVTIPDSVTSIGYDAFRGCDSLETITVDSDNSVYHSAGNCLIETATKTLIAGCKNSVIPDDGSVTSIGSQAFYRCNSLTSVTIPDSVTSIGDDAFYWCTSLTSVIIGDSVTSIGEYAFSYCTSLTSVTIPDSVTSIGRNGFSDCTSLTSVTIPDSVTSIGDYAFRDCESLGTITVDSGNSVYHSAGNCLIETSTKTLIAGCKNSVIPDDGSVTSIGEYAFYYCKSLTSVTIPDSVTSIGKRAFYWCTSLTSITIPDGVTSIGDSAFSGCDSLTSVIIGDSVTSIGDSAFYWCTSLTSITIPDGVTSIGEYAFSGCDSLTSITIPDSVTSIGDEVFSWCTSLTSVTIPDSVISIGEDAFYWCDSLTSVTFEGTVAQWNSISKGDFWNDYTPITEVICSDGTVSVG